MDAFVPSFNTFGVGVVGAGGSSGGVGLGRGGQWGAGTGSADPRASDPPLAGTASSAVAPSAPAETSSTATPTASNVARADARDLGSHWHGTEHNRHEHSRHGHRADGGHGAKHGVHQGKITRRHSDEEDPEDWCPLLLYDPSDGGMVTDTNHPAFWSNYYKKHPRRPHSSELAPWVAARYAGTGGNRSCGRGQLPVAETVCGCE